jgi:hypothetical protein
LAFDEFVETDFEARLAGFDRARGADTALEADPDIRQQRPFANAVNRQFEAAVHLLPRFDFEFVQLGFGDVAEAHFDDRIRVVHPLDFVGGGAGGDQHRQTQAGSDRDSYAAPEGAMDSLAAHQCELRLTGLQPPMGKSPT